MRYGICKGIELRKMGDKCIIYDSKNQEAHVVNESAANILESISKESTLDEIILNVKNTFSGVDLEILNSDINEVIEQYENMKIIEKI